MDGDFCAEGVSSKNLIFRAEFWMNFHGYQQPESFNHQVMHRQTIQEEKNLIEKRLGCLLRFSRPFLKKVNTIKNQKSHRGKTCVQNPKKSGGIR